MKKTLLSLMVFLIPLLCLAQNTVEKKFHNEKGQLIEVAKVTQIDGTTDALEVTQYNPENGVISHFINYNASKCLQNNSNGNENEALISSSVLGEYIKTHRVFYHGLTRSFNTILSKKNYVAIHDQRTGI